MAENNKGGFLNVAEKILRRKKTKVLQSLGKQGKTTDEILSEDCQKLDKQQEIACKLQKELRNYMHNAKALATASKHFYTTVTEAYEQEWDNHDQVIQIFENMDMLWTDYLDKLQEQVNEPLSKYLAHIPQIKAKVAKRGRKLIDYDNAKHNLEVHQNAKKKDEAKIAKTQEELDQVKKIYDDLNNELHLELPEFYNSRVNFYGNLFQSLFSTESVFHIETGKGSEQISLSAEKLAQDHAHNTYTPRKSIRNTVFSNEHLINGHSENGPDSPSSDSQSPSYRITPTVSQGDQSPNDLGQLTNGTVEADTSKEGIEGSTHYEDFSAHDKSDDEEIVTETITESVVKKVEATKAMTVTISVVSSMKDTTVSEPETDDCAIASSDMKMVEKSVNDNNLDISTSDEPEIFGDIPPQPPQSPPPGEGGNVKYEVSDDDDDDDDSSSLYQVPPLAKPVANDQPDKYLYTVLATHAYKGEDDDELTFDAHEVIYVTEFDDPEEQDPGWLMGVRKTTGQKGVFPENFTRKV